MKIAVSAGFFTEGDMDVDSGHLAKIMYKKLASGKYNAYLDIFSTNSKEGQRNYEFLKIYVSKNYSDPKTRVVETDKDNMKIIRSKVVYFEEVDDG